MTKQADGKGDGFSLALDIVLAGIVVISGYAFVYGLTSGPAGFEVRAVSAITMTVALAGFAGRRPV